MTGFFSGLSGMLAGGLLGWNDGQSARGDIWRTPDLPRFADVLPYEQYDARTGLYGLRSGRPSGEAVSFCLECLPQVGVSEQLEDSLQNLPVLLPEGAVLQVSMCADPDVSGLLSRYCRLRRGEGEAGRSGGMHRCLARTRYGYYSKLQGGLAPRNFRMMLSVAVAGRLDDPGTREVCSGLMQSCRSLLDTCAMPSQPLPPEELVALVGGVLNPRCVRRRRMPYSFGEPVADQCLLRDTAIEVSPGSLSVTGDGQPHTLIAMCAAGYPENFRLACVSALLGDPSKLNLAYDGPFIVTMCARILDRAAENTLVALRSARAQSNASSPMARLMPDYYRRQREDWSLASQVMGDGGNLALLSHHVTVQASVGREAAAVEAARAVWRACGFTIAVAEFMQVQGVLASLPMTLTPDFAHDLHRAGWMTRKTLYNIAHSMPAVAEWKGTRKPSLLLLGRRGQLCGFDLFDSPGNYNVVVAGSSGSGKSVFLNEIASAYLAQGAHVWIVDVGCSYQRTCELFGGQFMRFQSGCGICLNPFTAVSDIEADMRLLKPLFAQMISPSGLGDYQRARLEEAIRATWDKHGKEAGPDRLRDMLAGRGACKPDPRVDDMAAMLAPYCSGGMHGRWFEGTATVDFGSQLLVLELEELKSNPELQSVVLLQLMFLISQSMFAYRGQRKLVVIDEAWTLLRGKGTAEFVENGYRRARKYNGSFISASQSIADFYSAPAARAAIANSDWVFLLAQKAEEVARLCSDGHLNLDQAERELLLSLRTVPGAYSEVLVREVGVCHGVGRLVIDPFARLLFSSRPQDREDIERHLAGGCSVPDAIAAVLAERGEQQ